MSLNICQLYSAPLSLRAVSQWIPSANSLNWKFVFLKFRVLTLLFAWPVSLWILNSTRAWSLHAQAVPDLDLSNQLICVDKQWVKRCFSSGWAILSPGLRNYPGRVPRVSGTAYSLLCCFFSSCQDDFSPLKGSEPASMVLAVVKERKLHQHHPLDWVACNECRPWGFLGLGL